MFYLYVKLNLKKAVSIPITFKNIYTVLNMVMLTYLN